MHSITWFKMNKLMGDMGKKKTFEANEQVVERFEYVPCLGCTPENLYLAVVAWKDLGNGRFEYVNGKVFKK